MTLSIATTRSSDNPAAALADRWLLLGAYGPQARFHMTVAWIALAGLVCVDVVWLSFSRLSFATSNWDSIIRLVLFTAIAFGFCGLVSHRLAHETDRVGVALREGAKRVELFAVTMLLFVLLAVTVIAYCYLGTAAALPLQDARLAQIDQWMGFDWVAFVKFANSSELASWLLVKAYQSTPFMLTGTMLWFCISGQGARLAEFLALSCITSIGIAVGMMILPAAGAFAYYDLPFAGYENFGAGSGMWHHELLMALRTGQTTVIDFNVPNSNCLVTFPSGHTNSRDHRDLCSARFVVDPDPCACHQWRDAGVHDPPWRTSFVRPDRRGCDCVRRHLVRPASTGCPASSFGDQRRCGLGQSLTDEGSARWFAGGSPRNRSYGRDAGAAAGPVRMEGYGGPAQPARTIAQCLNGGLGSLEVECVSCKTCASQPLSVRRMGGAKAIYHAAW